MNKVFGVARILKDTAKEFENGVITREVLVHTLREQIGILQDVKHDQTMILGHEKKW